eukprot:364912-Chlamydomonas_euryale.AAC.20
MWGGASLTPPHARSLCRSQRPKRGAAAQAPKHSHAAQRDDIHAAAHGAGAAGHVGALAPASAAALRARVHRRVADRLGRRLPGTQGVGDLRRGPS